MTISAVILIKETLHSTIDWGAILPVLPCKENCFHNEINTKLSI